MQDTKRAHLKLDNAIGLRADKIVEEIWRKTGISTTRSSVLRSALESGLYTMEVRHCARVPKMTDAEQTECGRVASELWAQIVDYVGEGIDQTQLNAFEVKLHSKLVDLARHYLLLGSARVEVE